ncbi:MAG TPA: ABC transporter ATP-binding protein [Terracidiphilus sp.]|nr:ABC transporter ATP-binding protein [Terracidiphilus sp.]
MTTLATQSLDHNEVIRIDHPTPEGAVAAVSVRDLRKSYGAVEAVRGISFDIPEGTIFGLLGPNGAGKTSTIEMIEGIRKPKSGTVRVCGIDPFEDGLAARQLIGAQLQTTALHGMLRVREALVLFASFYKAPMDADKLLEFVGLGHRRKSYYSTLSGGEKQRVALALALVGSPRILFLDEPTAGLDAQIRHDLHDLILDMKEQGRTVLITTHYIEEAEKLCDRVGIIDEGQLHVIGQPRELIRELGEGDRLELTFRVPIEPSQIQALPGVESVIGSAEHLVVRGASGGRMLAAIAVHAYQAGNEVLEAKVLPTTLEDVYLKITGRRMSA